MLQLTRNRPAVRQKNSAEELNLRILICQLISKPTVEIKRKAKKWLNTFLERAEIPQDCYPIIEQLQSVIRPNTLNLDTIYKANMLRLWEMLKPHRDNIVNSALHTRVRHLKPETEGYLYLSFDRAVTDYDFFHSSGAGFIKFVARRTLERVRVFNAQNDMQITLPPQVYYNAHKLRRNEELTEKAKSIPLTLKEGQFYSKVSTQSLQSVAASFDESGFDEDSTYLLADPQLSSSDTSYRATLDEIQSAFSMWMYEVRDDERSVKFLQVFLETGSILDAREASNLPYKIASAHMEVIKSLLCDLHR